MANRSLFQLTPRYFAIASILTIIAGLLFTDSIPFLNGDILIHIISGMALAYAIAGCMARLDHTVLIPLLILGIVWEPIEWFIFVYGVYPQPGLIGWMTRDATILDAALFYGGSVIALVHIN